MQLTLKDFKKQFDAVTIRSAEKLTVRELEENPKGTFICFVDEKSDSWDVSIGIDKKGNVTQYSCDCGQSGAKPCLHNIAAVLKIGLQERATQKETKKLAKEAPAILLLKQVEEEPLKVWVKEILLSHKDLQLAFFHHFSGEDAQYKNGDATKITQDAIKSIISSNKKKVEISELKKIADLWKKVHEPIVAQYVANPVSAENFQLIQELITACNSFNDNILTNSNKLTKYIESVTDQVASHLVLLPDADFVKATMHYLSYFISRKTASKTFLSILENAFDLVELPRQKLLAEVLVQQLSSVDFNSFYHGQYLNTLVLHVLEKTDLFKTYAQLCKPIEFNNDYNIKLIRLLMSIDNYPLAEKYCIEQVNKNYYQEYNVPYWQLLREIYRIKGLQKGVDKISELLLPYSFELVDFQKIIEGLSSEEEKKKYRAAFLSKVRSKSRGGHIGATTFLFQLFDQEQNYNKILNEINHYTPYSLLLEYFDVLMRHNKEAFLEMLLKLDVEEARYAKDVNVRSDQADNREALLERITSNYTKTEINVALQDRHSLYRRGFFMSGSNIKDILSKRNAEKEG